MRRVGIEVSDIPTYEGSPNLAYFLTKIEERVIEPQRLLGLYFSLKATTARWWVHINNLSQNSDNVGD